MGSDFIQRVHILLAERMPAEIADALVDEIKRLYELDQDEQRLRTSVRPLIDPAKHTSKGWKFLAWLNGES
jgi:hypothetical protein